MMAVKRRTTDDVVLKHLAQEFKADPFKLRRILRAKFGKRGKWKWASGSDELSEVKTHLASIFGKNSSA